MGKKDAQATHSPPVDQYRKQIGRQTSKIDKKEMKENKRREGAKAKKTKAKGYGFLILFLLLAILVAVYLFLYLYLQNKSDQVKFFVSYIDQLTDKYVKPYLPW